MSTPGLRRALALQNVLARRHENRLRRAAAIAPPDHDTRRPRRLRVFLLWLLIVSACIFLDASGGWGFGWLEGYFYDSATATLADLRPQQKASEIVIVTVSDDTFASDNPIKIPGPPPPREYQAQLLRFLTNAKAKAVAFDFLFDTSQPGDTIFQRELERAKKQNTAVVLACLRDSQDRLLLPIPALRTRAKLGHILVQPAPDRPTIERVRGFIAGQNGEPIPAMSLQMALIGRDPKNWRLPLDRNGGFAIRYVGQSSEPFPFVPFEELVAPDTDREFYAQVFKDKYVFVGDATLIGNDIADTPLGAMPGVEVHAHALNTLLSQRFLRAAPAWILAAFVALLALPLAWLHDARRVSTLLLTALGLALAYSLLFVWLFSEMDFAVHLVGPVAALFLMLIAVLFERGWHEERERSRMFDALVLAASSAIETRDPATSGHSRRVTCLTVELAIAVSRSRQKQFRRVRFSRLQIKELCYSALLHDFGKIGVREAVLTKSHKLEPLHFQAVQSRLLLLQSERREQFLKQQIELLHNSSDNCAAKLGVLQAQMQSEIEALENDRLLLARANDPQVTFLPDEEYSRLEELLARLEVQTYCDENGEQKPLLTAEEKSALQIRKGSLTDDEFRQIQSHAQMSYDFLKQVKWTRDLENLAHIAWGHHEKLSGKGYPRGVSAQDIPMPTRMMTIADIFDALTASDRPYKKAMPIERALKILHEEAAANSVDADLLKVFVDEKIYESLTDGRAEKLLPTLF
jgi:HD-GYP domain-containing protein (c-di-GMP phosphodiesterase class II)